MNNKNKISILNRNPTQIIPITVGNKTFYLSLFWIKNFYSTINSTNTSYVREENQTKLNPNWITGFSDAEACFTVLFRKNCSSKVGYQVQPVFEIELHKQDLPLLIKIQSFFNGIGKIYFKPNSVIFIVTKFQDLVNIIIPHFKLYSLRTQKSVDFLLWCKIIDLMQKREHLTLEGLHNILSIKASLNWGLSNQLKKCFPMILPIIRPEIEINNNIEPYWLAGFVSGDGSFDVNIHKSNTHLVGFQVQLRFRIAQNNRDRALLSNIIEYFQCGSLYFSENLHLCEYTVTKFSEINSKIIPFFKKYEIEGIKFLDFQDFCEIATLIEEGSHKSVSGLESIHMIVSRMNSNRIK
jgi:LAGLIDADG endonuclease